MAGEEDDGAKDTRSEDEQGDNKATPKIGAAENCCPAVTGLPIGLDCSGRGRFVALAANNGYVFPFIATSALGPCQVSSGEGIGRQWRVARISAIVAARLYSAFFTSRIPGRWRRGVFRFDLG